MKGINGIGLTGLGREVWSAVAINADGRIFRPRPSVLPLCGDPDEVAQRLVDHVSQDPDFAREYASPESMWTFFPIRVDRGLRLYQAVPS